MLASQAPLLTLSQKCLNSKIPCRYPKVRSDPQTPAGNVDSGDGDPGGFAGPCREAGVWRQARGLVAALVQTSTKEMEVSVGRLCPGAGSTLWQRKEIQYWTFTKQQTARESTVLKHSNKLAHSRLYTVNIPIVRHRL